MILPIGPLYRDAVRFSGAATSISASVYLNGVLDALTPTLGTAVDQGDPAQTLQPFTLVTSGLIDGTDIEIRITGTVGGSSETHSAYIVVETIETPDNAAATAARDYAQAAAERVTLALPDAAPGEGGGVITYGAGVGQISPEDGGVYLTISQTAVLDGVTTLLGRLTSARAGYLDNLNIGGPVASQADVQAINESASRRLVLQTTKHYERPESSSSTYEIELRTYTADGAAANAGSTPTLTATGLVTGSLSANLSAASNPATGVYRWTYSVASNATLEQVRFDASAAMADGTHTLATYTLVADFVAATWSTTDAAHLTAIYNKLPSKSYLAGTVNADGDVQLDEATGTPADSTGTTTLLSRLTGTRAGYLDNISTAAQIRSEIDANSTQLAKLGTPAGASLSADLAAIKTDTAGAASSAATAATQATTAATEATAANGKAGAIQTVLSGITSLAYWLRTLARKSTPDATALSEINSGGGTYSATTDSQEAIRDRGDAAWLTGAGGGTGGGTVLVSPAQATVSSPRYTTKDMAPIYAGSAPVDAWTCVDANRVAIDLSAATLRYVVATADYAAEASPEELYSDEFSYGAAWSYESGAGIAVSGDDNNVVTVTQSGDDVVAGEYRYWLLNLTSRQVLATGRLPVKPIVAEAWT